MLNTTIAHYKVTAKLGQGGMGEVYRATDTKLGREVAIKVLPEALAGDAERLARFQREAELLASLNHANIAAIYGLEESGANKALVLELVEGDTLADRVKKGPMIVEDALEACLGIAEALEAAHEKGIIHRDLKPANVKFTSDGKVKVLDFGLAKALDAEPETMTSTGSLADSPTITADYTKPGTILGTAAYMSPEQARGKGLDKRTDIWSFGCVLFECLTGKKLFQGEDVSETLASIIKGAPDWGSLPTNTPPTIQLLLRKCLAKDRKRRLPDIAAARIDLAEAIEDPSSSFIRLSEGGLAEKGARSGMGWLGVGMTVVIASLVIGAVGWFLRLVDPALEPRYSEILFDKYEGKRFFTMFHNRSFALSPDGRSLVYLFSESTRRLYLRDFTTGLDAPIPIANNPWLVSSPFFSPDGESLGFVAEGGLYTIPTRGGRAQRISSDPQLSTATHRGFDWSQMGQIVVAMKERPLRLVSVDGTESREITTFSEGETHKCPQFLDDEHVLFLVANDDELGLAQAVVVNTRTLESTPLGIEPCHDIRFVASGHLLCSVYDEIYAVPFDSKSLMTLGSRKRVLSHVRKSERSHFDVANDGTLAYLPGGATSVSQSAMVWIDADSRVSLFSSQPGEWKNVEPSPDRRKVALTIEGDIWVLDTSLRDTLPPRPLTRNSSEEKSPVWSPDGRFIYYYSNRNGRHGIWKANADTSRLEELRIYESATIALYPTSATKRFLMLMSREPSGAVSLDFSNPRYKTNSDIWKLDLDAPVTEPALFLSQPFGERDARISPNEKWIAYSSNESEQFGVYVVSMDGAEKGTLISPTTSGHSGPRWAQDGTQLFWRSKNQIYSIDLLEQDGQLVTKQNMDPKKFIWIPFNAGTLTPSLDGNRILAHAYDLEDVLASQPPHLKMISNWFTELNELVPLDEE